MVKITKNIFYNLISSFESNDAIFLTFYNEGSIVGTYSYSDFLIEVKKIASIMNQLHYVNSQSKVCIIANNHASTLILYSATLLLGATLIPIDPNLPLSQLENIVKMYSPEITISSILELDKIISIDDILKHDCPSLLADDFFINTDSSKVIFSSSGTTGKSKGVIQTLEAILCNAHATISALELKSDEPHMVCLPVFHVNAFCFSFFTSVVLKNRIVLCKNFYLPKFFDIASIEKVRIISLIPPIIQILANDPRENIVPPGQIRLITSAASALSKEALTKFYQKFFIPIIQGYGLSETVNFSTFSPANLNDEQYKKFIDFDHKVSIGTAVDGNQLHLLNPEGEEINQENTTGEIFIHGNNIMIGYYNNESATNDVLRNGLFRTGDLAYYRIWMGKRYYYINGRIKEIAKINGKLIHLNDIDEAIMNLPEVEDCATVSFLDNDENEKIGAVIVTKSHQYEQIKKLIYQKLSKHEIPTQIIWNREIMRTASGKKKRAEMATWFKK